MKTLLILFASDLVISDSSMEITSPRNGVSSQEDPTINVYHQFTAIPPAKADPIAAPTATCERLIGNFR